MNNKNIMIQGTASNAGKSVLVSALCRIFNQDGYTVAPFKSQNMALNSFITKDGHEMGHAQVVQAEAARVEPNVLMNPVLLKPSSEKKAQVIFMGKVMENMSATTYHDYKPKLKEKISDCFSKLSKNHDIVVLEGAGSPAEINLRENDIVNMGMAEISDSPVLIVGDIDRGGVFASIYGTILLLTEEERKRVKGVIINKFRGDVEILKPGVKMLEDLIDIPVLGVIPYADFDIEDEDSLSNRLTWEKKGGDVKIEVIYLPHMSNFTDFNTLEIQEDVELKYLKRGESLSDPDIVIIPGSKNTIEDLLYLKNTGLEEQILRHHRKNKMIFGICGGYQILGKTLEDIDSVESKVQKVNGLSLLDINTKFKSNKTTTQVKGHILNHASQLKELSNASIYGYEIHMGKSVLGPEAKPFLALTSELGEEVDKVDGAINEKENVIGTYIHGIFDDLNFTRKLINLVRVQKGLDKVEGTYDSYDEYKEVQYDKLADVVRENLDIQAIYDIMEKF